VFFTGDLCCAAHRHYGFVFTRNILGQNSHSAASGRDERGYLPVEWWILSLTRALNPEPSASIAQEGVTELILKRRLSDHGATVCCDCRTSIYVRDVCLIWRDRRQYLDACWTGYHRAIPVGPAHRGLATGQSIGYRRLA